MAARTYHHLTGNLYLNSGSGIVYADGSGLMSASVPFDSIARGTPGYVASFKSTAPNAGVLTTGIATSESPLAGALVKWDSTGSISGVSLLNGAIGGSTFSFSNGTVNYMNILNVPSVSTYAATVEYVDNAISTIVGGSVWVAPVINFASVPPVAPSNGDRYVALATSGPWVKDNIYQWNSGSSTWVVTLVINGTSVTSLQGDPFTPLTGPASYIFTASTGWIPIGFNGAHDNLIGKKNTSSVSSDTIQIVSPVTNHVVYSWATNTDKIWTGIIELLGVSSTAAGEARFTWNVNVKNHSGTASFTIRSKITDTTGDLYGTTASLAVQAIPTQQFLDIRVSIPTAVSSVWHATIEATLVPIVNP